MPASGPLRRLRVWMTPPRVSLAAARPAVPLLLVAAGIWPVWSYLWRADTAPGTDLTGACVLAGALTWAIWLSCGSGPGSPGGTPLAASVSLAAYAVGYTILPALARAALGLAAFALAILGLPGVGWRERSGLLVLSLLAAPSPDTLNFFLGGPLRAASMHGAAAWLSASGTAARVEGAALRINGHLFSVDAPCSGVNGLWSGLFVASVLATQRRLSPPRTALLLAAAAALSVPANGWRAVALIYFSRLASALPPGSAEDGHAAVGLVVFAATVALLAWLAGSLAPVRRAPADSRRGMTLAGTGKAGMIRLPFPGSSFRGCPAGLVAPVALLAALAPLTPAYPRSTPLRNGFPGWPTRWLGQPLGRLPDTAMDRRWAAVSPGPLARFALPDGSELLLRWVDRPGRGVHPPEDCYRGSGCRVIDLSPIRAPAPVPGTREERAAIWQRFRAERGGEAWEVRGVIVSRTGETYPDPGWWWWRVVGPGATDRGPWWAVTIQSRR